MTVSGAILDENGTITICHLIEGFFDKIETFTGLQEDLTETFAGNSCGLSHIRAESPWN